MLERARHAPATPLWGAVALALALLWWLDPVAQDPAYHRYADQRMWWGVPYTLNVASNLALLIVGAAGLVVVGRRRALMAAGLFDAYLVLFAGVLLTGLGSAYYHLAPSNATLVWDRLPMTLGFMGFLASVIGEMVAPQRARRWLWPLVAVGLASVGYWHWSETRGAGDLRLYGLVQFLPLVLTLLLLWRYPRPAGYAPAVLGLLGLYAVSKPLELLDASVYAQGGIVSGHTLKHVVAAAAVACLLPMLRRRYRRS